MPVSDVQLMHVKVWIIIVFGDHSMYVWGFPVKQQTTGIISTGQALTILSKFGYTRSDDEGPFASLKDEETTMKDSLKLFQKVWGLQQTGELDTETETLLTSPRCGNSDAHLISKAQGIAKRYVLGEPFKKAQIEYRIQSYSKKLSNESTEDAIHTAFYKWSLVSDVLVFFESTRKYGTDIKIKFGEGWHGDNTPFDGPGGTLGHAFGYPLCMAHLDDAERWYYSKDKLSKGYNVLGTLMHEIGHCLGLEHSNNDKAMMYPYKTDRKQHGLLHQDDISGIRALYDDRLPRTTTTPKPEPSYTRWCNNPFLDAALYTSIDSKATLMFFRADEVLAYTKSGKVNNYPMKITDHFKSLEYVSEYDAAFRIRVGYGCGSEICGVNEYYFFKGENVTLWHLGMQVYKAKISDKFPGIPRDVRAAFVRFVGKSAHIHFIKGYYVYVYEYGKGVIDGYPKSLRKEFSGNAHIDAAVSFRLAFHVRETETTIVPVTLLMEGAYYTAYLYDRIDPAPSSPKFPRPTNRWLLGCKSKPSNLMSDDPGVHRRKRETEHEGLNIEDDESGITIGADGRMLDSNLIRLLNDNDQVEEIEELQLRMNKDEQRWE